MKKDTPKATKPLTLGEVYETLRIEQEFNQQVSAAVESLRAGNQMIETGLGPALKWAKREIARGGRFPLSDLAFLAAWQVDYQKEAEWCRKRAAVLPVLADLATELDRAAIDLSVFRKGNPAFDVYLIFRRLNRVFKGLPQDKTVEEEAIQAADRLASGYYKYPVPTIDWNALGMTQVVVEQAASWHMTPEAYTKMLVQQGLFGVVVEPVGKTPKESLKEVEKRLRKAVTKDILGPRYWGANAEDELVEDYSEEDDEDPGSRPKPIATLASRLEKQESAGLQPAIREKAALELASLMARANLSAREIRLSLEVEAHGDVQKAAAAMGISRDNAYQIRARALAKLRKAARQVPASPPAEECWCPPDDSEPPQPRSEVAQGSTRPVPARRHK
jgi:hypothetical protein